MPENKMPEAGVQAWCEALAWTSERRDQRLPLPPQFVNNCLGTRKLETFGGKTGGMNQLRVLREQL